MSNTSKYSEIFDYMRTCPAQAKLWSIGGQESGDEAVILPQGASPATQYQESIDVLGNYEAVIEPYPSVYEDYQINCYKYYDNADSSAPSANINVMALDEVQAICDWVKTQNENNNLPKITGLNVISVECNPFVPQIRYVDEEKNIIAYFVTLRVRYVNPFKRKSVEIDAD